MEGDIADFVPYPIIKNHIFAGGGHIAEAPADFKTEEIAAGKALGAVAPIPGRFIRPDAATPI